MLDDLTHDRALFTTLLWACAKRRLSWLVCYCDRERRQLFRVARARMAHDPIRTSFWTSKPFPFLRSSFVGTSVQMHWLRVGSPARMSPCPYWIMVFKSHPVAPSTARMASGTASGNPNQSHSSRICPTCLQSSLFQSSAVACWAGFWSFVF